LQRVSEGLDDFVGLFSPRAALNRKACRFGYEVLDGHRTRKKRSKLGGTGDQQLTETSLARLRDICRDMGRNNPLVKGMLRLEANGVVGTDTRIQARSSDSGWNKAAEQLRKERMIESPIDVTGRYNEPAFLKKMYYSYRRDGDMLVLFTGQGIQAIEGEQCGTPYGKGVIKPKDYDITNGVAVSKRTGRVIGYYIGRPNKWGYINNAGFKMYEADVVHHVFNAERFSASRGEPALTSSVKWIDNLCSYIDAELIAAKVNACYPMMVIGKDNTAMPSPFTHGLSSSGLAGKDEAERPLQKIVPGQIWHGETGEKVEAIGSTRPASAFDPFVLRMLSIIGRPMCMPLMLITGDFSGATFMNARIAYGQARDNWKDEQELVIKPFARMLWRFHIDKWVAEKKLSARDDMYAHEVQCKRWPYVDPYKEAKADEVQIENRTTNRTIICARQGREFPDVVEQLGEEENYLKEKGLKNGPVVTDKKSEENNGKQNDK